MHMLSLFMHYYCLLVHNSGSHATIVSRFCLRHMYHILLGMAPSCWVVLILVAAHEQSEVILARLTNPPISSNAPTKPCLSITMSQASQTTIMDAAFCHCANAGDHANALKLDSQSTGPIAVPGPSTSTATATPSTSIASLDYPNTDRPDTNTDKLPGKRAECFTGVCANCGATAIGHCCLGCRLVFYCTQRCQALQWDQHKFFCQRIRFTQGFGNP